MKKLNIPAEVLDFRRFVGTFHSFLKTTKGQTKTVTVYKLVAKGTIEEKIVAMQQQKAKLAENILGGEGVGSAVLTREDLMEILW